jgi:MFS family permease
MARPLGEVIDSFGFGLAQFIALIFGGGVWLADGAVVLLIGSVTQTLSDDWDLRGIERGLLVSVVYIGVLLGNISSGSIGDEYGRRYPILMSYLGIVLFSGLSAASQGIKMMALARFAVGVSIGIGQPAWNTLGVEISPTSYRVTLNAWSQILFCVGELYGAALVLLDDEDMQALDWRRLILLGALPAAVLGVPASCMLIESPVILAARGRTEEAEVALKTMRRQNGADHLSAAFQVAHEDQAAHGIFYQMKIIFGPQFLFTTFVVSVSTFTLNFNFYGGLYAFPQVLPQLDLHFSPAFNLALGAAAELPGFLLGSLAGSRMTRKSGMLAYLATSVAAIILLLFGLGTLTGVANSYATLAGFLGMKVFVNVGFIVVYVYASEIYPSVARTSGTAFCLAAGRVGSALCPLVYELCHSLTGSYEVFFFVIIAMLCCNAALVLLLTIETAGQQLAIEADEIIPLVK